MNYNQKEWIVFSGTIVHSTEECPMEILTNMVIGIRNNRIEFIDNSDKIKYYQDRFGFESQDIEELHRGEFLMPGLIDTHIHSCQYSFMGSTFGKPLLDWLKAYTYPVESKFNDVKFANGIHNKLVRRTIGNGTTTAQYFCSIHTDASLDLADVTNNFGQRAFIGKCCMDQNELDLAVSYYEESASKSVAETERFIDKILERQDPLLTPVVTPRFSVTVSPTLMSSLGEIAAKYKVPVQSHLSENTEEVKAAMARYPKRLSYTDIYKYYGLLNKKTVMAHSIHLSEDEIKIFQETGASVAHCPSSNYNLRSGLCQVRRLLDNGINVGLGTDAAGGHTASILNEMRQAFSTSFALHCSLQNDGHYKNLLSYEEIFRLATLGGAKSLRLADKIGNFEVGKEFDALVINTNVSDSPVDIFPSDSEEDIILKFLSHGDDRNIRKIFIAGKRIIVN
ncbi:GDA (predicted) [Pycnogonum litorale]